MDSLLNYKSEKSSVTKFKDSIEEYNKITDLLKKTEKDYEDVFFNKEIAEKIKRKNARIFELQEQMRKMLEDYKRTGTEVGAGSQKTIQDIILFYLEELSPEYMNLDKLKYPLKEIIVGGTSDVPIFKVIQKSLESNRLDYNYTGDDPQVIAYKV